MITTISWYSRYMSRGITLTWWGVTQCDTVWLCDSQCPCEVSWLALCSAPLTHACRARSESGLMSGKCADIRDRCECLPGYISALAWTHIPSSWYSLSYHQLSSSQVEIIHPSVLMTRRGLVAESLLWHYLPPSICLVGQKMHSKF